MQIWRREMEYNVFGFLYSLGLGYVVDAISAYPTAQAVDVSTLRRNT